MTLSEWVEAEKRRIERFAADYRRQAEGQAAENWPLDLAPGDWDDQYLMFTDPNAPD